MPSEDQKAEAKAPSVHALSAASGSASLRACVETLAHELECDCNYNFAGLSDINGESFAAKLARVRAAADVMEQWLRLCELGLQDVVPEWVRPSIEELWEKTDAVCKPNAQTLPPLGRLATPKTE